MLPFLQVIDHGEEMDLNEVAILVADRLSLSEKDRNIMMENRHISVLRYRCGWTRTYLKKAGLITLPQRRFVKITERGKTVLKSNPGVINKKFLSQFEEFAEFISSKRRDNGIEIKSTDIESQEQTPEEALEQSHKELRASLELELLDQVKESTPAFFEQLVVDLLVKMGYGGTLRDAGQAVGQSRDGGIDGIIKEDRLGLDTIYIQAKRWTNGVVGRPEIQRFAGALQGNRARKGVFITTSSFTKEAYDYIAGIDTRIILIDGNNLASYMVDYNVGVTTIHTYEVKRIDSDYFSDE